MKRILLVLCVLLVFFAFPAVSYAHSGKTDANGGHYNKSTGEYHYHHGYSAHQHYDMNGDGIVDCPYDFDDKTGESSGGGSTSTSKAPSKSRPVLVDMCVVLSPIILFFVGARLLHDRKKEKAARGLPKIKPSSSPQYNPMPRYAISRDVLLSREMFVQSAVDDFYRELFFGQRNPYTGDAIVCEADYLEYLCRLRAEQRGDADADISLLRANLIRDAKQARRKALSAGIDPRLYAQHCIDKVVRHVFRHAADPYTGQPVRTEADYRAYLSRTQLLPQQPNLLPPERK